MKIVYFGSGLFAVNILEAICRGGHEVILVVTQPDRGKGRHLLTASTPVKSWALAHALTIFQPEDVNDSLSLNMLTKADADCFVVASYGQILSKKVLALPHIMPVNAHGSLLPQYRGAAPIARALIDGVKTTGVTFIKMNEFMDRGDILLKKKIRIEKHDDAISLDHKLSCLAAEHINAVLEAIVRKRIKCVKQVESKATYAPLLKKEDGCIRWKSSAEDIDNSFKGCKGWPGTYTFYQRRLLKVFDLKIGPKKIKGRPGEIVGIGPEALEVACSSGSVLIHEVLPESGKRMSAKSFAAGYRVKIGDYFGVEIPLQDE